MRWIVGREEEAYSECWILVAGYLILEGAFANHTASNIQYPISGSIRDPASSIRYHPPASRVNPFLKIFQIYCPVSVCKYIAAK
jgi:hypothetical protein